MNKNRDTKCVLWFNSSKHRIKSPQYFHQPASCWILGPKIIHRYKNSRRFLIFMERSTDALDRLESILNAVDSNKEPPSDDHRAQKRTVSDLYRIQPPDHDWRRYLDSKTGKYYYHNIKSNEVTWTPPVDITFAESHPPSLSGVLGAADDTPSSSSAYSAAAVFSTKTGALEGVASQYTHYDREHRQMSAFFDPSTLDQNRAEAKVKKEKISKLGINWKQYKSEKTEKKKQSAKAWLMEN